MIEVPDFIQEAAEFEEDLFTQHGAERLAVTIERQWAQAGHAGVKCRIEPMSVKARGRGTRIYVVRSNLVNGLPPSRQVISAGIKRQGAK